MKLVRKHLKSFALSLLILFFVTSAHSNASALGTYRATNLPVQSTQMNETAAIPALAVYGAVLLGAFVIGAVNGYYERQSAAGQELEMTRSNSNSSDFSSFDN